MRGRGWIGSGGGWGLGLGRRWIRFNAPLLVITFIGFIYVGWMFTLSTRTTPCPNEGMFVVVVAAGVGSGVGVRTPGPVARGVGCRIGDL